MRGTTQSHIKTINLVWDYERGDIYNMAWGLITYQDTGRREDLLDVIGDVSPDETPLMTLFGTSTAKGTYLKSVFMASSMSPGIAIDTKGFVH